MAFSLSSPAFSNGERIPAKYTCDGDNISPPLTFTEVPTDAVVLALIMDDPDVPRELRPSGMFDHWTLFDIPASATGIKEDESLGTPGLNGRGEAGYTGPCPPVDYEPTEHRYFFRLYALDAPVELSSDASKDEVLAAMEGHILQAAELMGRYSRK